MRNSSKDKQKSPKQSNIGTNSCQPVQGSIGQFMPPQHKYIQMDKFDSAFFKDNNQEDYALKRAFNANNFTYLRGLPSHIERNFLLDQRFERVKQQIFGEGLRRVRTPHQIQQTRTEKLKQIKKTKIGLLGYFETFPYQESEYELPKKLANQERLQFIQKRKQINDKDFIPAGFEKKMKYEDPFAYVDRANPHLYHQYIFPFHLPEDTYDSFQQNQRRQRIVDQELRLAGQFYPAKTQKSLTTVNKSHLPQILTQIQFYFKKFLKGHYGYFIGVNKRDHIEILFESKYLQDSKLSMIMSGICENEILCRFCLRKNYKKFGTIKEQTNFIQFVILPPWVKQIQELHYDILSGISKSRNSM